ncbi:hypothetical protein H8526_001078 [Salmonella enterica]|nr:hypothetical protein [Salmonella enterica]
MSQSEQQKVLLQGVLTASDGKILPGASLTLKEADSGQIITLTTSSSAAYSFFIQPGTWCVTVQQPDDTPRNIGVLSVNAATKDGALNDLLTSLTPSSLDMSVLGFMRGLVSEAERATESINLSLNQSAIGQNLKDSEILATQTKQSAQDAQQALEEVKLIVRTLSKDGAPGQPGEPGPPGRDGADGQPGRDGASAYDIWKENQPAGADTSLTAFLDSMKGSGGVSMEDVSDYMNQYTDKYRLSLVGKIVVARWWPQPGGSGRIPELKHPVYGYSGPEGTPPVGYLTSLDSEDELLLPGAWEAMQYVAPGKVGLFIRTR